MLRITILRLLAVITGASSLAHGATIDITNDPSVLFDSGATIEVVLPFPDVSLIGGHLPNNLFDALIGPLPAAPASSYQFTDFLTSLDGSQTLTLPALTGVQITACLDSFPCNTTVPAISLTLSYIGSSGFGGILPASGIPGQPAAKFVFTNVGPSLVLGGVFPGQTLAQGFAMTFGDGTSGVGMDAISVSLTTREAPEPATMILVGGIILAATVIRFYRRAPAVY